MLHPSYTELMKVINGDSEEEKVISSRYSIVLASAKRARQIIAGDMPLVEEKVRKTGCLGIPKHPYLYRQGVFYGHYFVT